MKGYTLFAFIMVIGSLQASILMQAGRESLVPESKKLQIQILTRPQTRLANAANTHIAPNVGNQQLKFNAARPQNLNFLSRKTQQILAPVQRTVIANRVLPLNQMQKRPLVARKAQDSGSNEQTAVVHTTTTTTVSQEKTTTAVSNDQDSWRIADDLQAEINKVSAGQPVLIDAKLAQELENFLRQQANAPTAQANVSELDTLQQRLNDLNTNLREFQNQDQDFREDIQKLKAHKDELTASGDNTDENVKDEIIKDENEIADLQEKCADIDQNIKETEIAIILVEIDQVGYRKDQAIAQQADQQIIQDLDQKSQELQNELQAVVADHQISDEILQSIKENNERIKAIYKQNNSQSEVSGLLNINRRLQNKIVASSSAVNNTKSAGIGRI